MSEVRSKITGAFTGYHGDALFHLTNGQVWQQRRYRYRYKYKYRPDVRIYNEGGRRMMEVDGMDEPIEVVRVSIVAEGHIVSTFKGFQNAAIFQFNNGSTWEQLDGTYEYHYAHRPEAAVIDGVSGVALHVDGMASTVRVRRVR